eukprot:gb/GECH01002828.1/.p1 GENE.gb/GECH01002828.1/~~gb/GECH01002828.1/.p1  ORF type:complete len:558 (+),score=137.25 gb/GECH01002828.1/:1-1674(+)
MSNSNEDPIKSESDENGQVKVNPENLKQLGKGSSELKLKDGEVPLTEALKTISESQQRSVASIYSCLAGKAPPEIQKQLINDLLDLMEFTDSHKKDFIEFMNDGHNPYPFTLQLEKQYYWLVIWNFLIISLKHGTYDSRIRVLIHKLSIMLGIEVDRVAAAEDGLAMELQKALEKIELENRNTSSKGRWWKIGLGAVVGGTALILTGGLAAPIVLPALGGLAVAVSGAASVVGLGSAAAAGGALLMAGGVPMITGLFGATGAGLTAYKMSKRTGSLSRFEFQSMNEQKRSGMQVVIGISGWIQKNESEFSKHWESLQEGSPFGEHYALVWEPSVLRNFGKAVRDLILSSVASEAAKWWIKTVSASMASVIAAVGWPMTILSVTKLIDNPWNMVVNRAEKAGRLMAEVLIERVHGNRPVSLVGYSVGARAIFFCLEELANRGEYGIVENVALLGGAIPCRDSDRERWQQVRKVVAGRLINAYATYDWVLAYLYRTAHLTYSVAGLWPVKVDGVENHDVSDLIKGHGDYSKPEVLSKLLEGLELQKNTLETDPETVLNF